MNVKVCTHCQESKPANREHFGSTPAGNLRGQCRECMRQRSAKYEANNKDARQQRDNKRAATNPDARTAFDSLLKEELYKAQHAICVCCGLNIKTVADAEVDHIVPLSRGGAHNRDNFLLSHSKCNREKHNKTLIEHWEWRVRVGLDTENVGRKLGLI